MKVRGLGYALNVSVVLALLTGCGASQPAAGVPAMITQGPKAPGPARPASKSRLLYVVTSDQIDMLTYPKDKVVGKIRGRYYGRAATDPNNGEVCFDAEKVDVFAHGATKPLGIIDTPAAWHAYDCAFDPTTDDIAVSVEPIERPGGYIAIYQSPSGTPTTYSIPSNMSYPCYLGYDNKGDLFVDGYPATGGDYVLAELPKGGDTFADVTLNEHLGQMWAIQWDGAYITVAGPHGIRRLQISGSNGTVVGTTTLLGAWLDENGTLWIQGPVVIGPHAHPHPGRYLGFWHYPAGGKAFKIIKTLNPNQNIRIGSATVSVAPSR